MSDNRYDRNGRNAVRGGTQGRSYAHTGSPQPYRRLHGGRGVRPVWFVVIMDLLFFGVALNIYALILTTPSTFENTEIITQMTPTPSTSPSPSPTPSPTQTLTSISPTPKATPTEQPVDQGMWGAKFPDKFTSGDVEKTANSYRSKDINVSWQKAQGNGATYFIADIYVRNLQNFSTTLAKDKMGKFLDEPQQQMAKRSNAILSINTDNYGDLDKGYAVRNGVLGRDTAFDDILVLYSDGTMKTFLKGQYKKSVMENAWQVWSFGPMLLDANGQPKEKFNTTVSPKNPRSAMGYYEPGHYCFVVVDGRQAGYSDGLSMKELSSLMYSLGCKVAYNMDGGQSSMMFFMGELVNKPYRGGRPVSDISIIAEVK